MAKKKKKKTVQAPAKAEAEATAEKEHLDAEEAAKVEKERIAAEARAEAERKAEADRLAEVQAKAEAEAKAEKERLDAEDAAKVEKERKAAEAEDEAEEVTVTFQPGRLGLTYQNGIVVAKVYEGTQADALGVEPNWVLKKIDGAIVTRGFEDEIYKNAKEGNKPYRATFEKAQAAAVGNGVAHRPTSPLPKAPASKQAFAIRVSNIPFSMNEDTLRKDFAAFGHIVRWKCPSGKNGRLKGMAFIEYKSKKAFDAALKVDGEERGGRKLKVTAVPAAEEEANTKQQEQNGEKGKDKGAKGKGKGGKDLLPRSHGKGKDNGKGKHGYRQEA